MHKTHRFILEATRDTKKTLYVVAGFYVVVGFVLSVVGAVNGDRLGTFLGFLIISGAISAAALIRAVLRIGMRISAITETLEDIRQRLDGLAIATADSLPKTERFLIVEAQHEESPAPSSDIGGGPSTPTVAVAHGPPRAAASAPAVVDLMVGATSDPDQLASAFLDRSVFPRLVTLLEREPLVGPAAAVEAAALDHRHDKEALPTSLFRPITHGVPGEEARSAEVVARSVSAVAEAVAVENLRREWKMACENRDLLRARRILLTLADTAEDDEVERLQAELDELTERTEASLRREFGECAKRRDFEGLLQIGERIRELLPDRPVAEDFARIEPMLVPLVGIADEAANGRNGETSPVNDFHVAQTAS